jgi:enamine deaminase RidA (YjgF/YER057c/UK114 family)
MHTILQPEGWMKPVGYANGVAARGRQVFVAGQIGWNGQSQFETDDFVGQFRDKREYLANLKGVGEAYREVIGRNFPAIAAVQVVALVEDRAKVEIQAIAVVPE